MEIVNAGRDALEIQLWRGWAENNGNRVTDLQYVYGLILLHTPNTESVKIDGKKTKDAGLVLLHLLNDTRVWYDGLDHLHRFIHLKDIEINSGPTLGLRELLPLFRWPSLIRIRLEQLQDTYEVRKDIPWSLLTQPSSIRHLEFHYSSLRTETLSKILGACPSLLKLELTKGNKQVQDIQ